MRTLVFNGWAAGPETWELCEFERDWVFNYVEQMNGLPARVIKDMDEVILVGFSMGGMSALRIFLDYPEKVKGMILVSTTPRMMEDRANGWIGMSERRCEALRVGTEMVFRNDPSPMYESVAMKRGLECLRRTDLRSELERVDCAIRASIPVIIFQSEHDGIVRAHNAEYLGKLFPNAMVNIIDGSEHVLPITIPERIDFAISVLQKQTEI